MKIVSRLLPILLLFACKQGPKYKNNTYTKGDPVLEALRNDITSHPDSVRLYDVIIDTLTNRGDAKGAAAWCDQLLTRDEQKHFVYHLVKADLLRSARQYPEAIASYRTFIASRPEEPTVYLSLASTLAEAGDTSTISFCQQVETAFPIPQVKGGLLFVRGVYFNTIGQYANARPWLDKAIQYDYTFAEAYMEKGYGLYDEGKKTEAKQVFAKLTEVNPRYADGWYWLAKCAEESGSHEEAIENYQKALSLDPKLEEANKALERLRKKQ